MKWKKTSYRFFLEGLWVNWVSGAPLTRLILYEATYRCFGTTLNFQFFFNSFSSHAQKRNKSYIVIFFSSVSTIFFLQQSEVHTRSHVHKSRTLWHTLQTKLSCASPKHLHIPIEHLQIFAFTFIVYKSYITYLFVLTNFSITFQKNVIKSKKNPT